QFMAPDFASVSKALRSGGVTSHFTMGGHYSSFAPETILKLIPELDSVIRVEGEAALTELTNAIVAGDSWREIRGIAWRDGDEVHLSAPRKDSIDLDALPWPERTYAAYNRHSLPSASVLASRGCPW